MTKEKKMVKNIKVFTIIKYRQKLPNFKQIFIRSEFKYTTSNASMKKCNESR